MKYPIILIVLLFHSTSSAHVKFSEAERTIIRLQDERRGIDTIARFLDSKDEKVAWRAAVALANIGDTSSRRILITRLSKETRPNVIDGIAFALGVLGPDVKVYQALVVKSKVVELSNEIAIGLARCIPKEKVSELSEMFDAVRDDKHLLPISSALMELGLRKLTNDGVAELVRTLENAVDPQVRWQAIYYFARLQDSAFLLRHIDIIKNSLADIGSSECRMFAAIALGYIHNSEAGNILINAARSETEWRVHVNILNAIGKMPRFSSAIFDVLKKAVDESIADSSITNHVAHASLDALDGMIDAGKLSSPDSETVAEWLAEYFPIRELHTDQSPDIHSQAIIPYTRLAPVRKEKYQGVQSYLSTSYRTGFINACHAVGLVVDSGAFFLLMKEILRVDASYSPFLLDGLHIAWETAKKNPAYYDILERKYLAAAYRQMLIRYPNQSDNIAIVSKTMEAMQDSLIVTDSLRAEAQAYLLQYLYKYSIKRYQDQLLPILSAVIWLKPSGDSIAAKLTEIMNSAADEWGNKQIADSAYKALTVMGRKVSPPDVKIIRQPINWDEIERMPDTLILQSRFGFLYIKLNTFETPLSALNIYHLAKGSYFVFNYIHRLVPNFVIQTGDLTGTGYGGPGYTIRTEIAPIRYDSLGVCGMASDGKDTEGSQWFITHCPTPHLNTRYTIWGEVVIGKEKVELFQWNDKIDDLIPHR